jgi:hypothetical protein
MPQRVAAVAADSGNTGMNKAASAAFLQQALRAFLFQ